MKKLLIITMALSSITCFAQEIKSYAQAKHNAYLIVKDYPGIFSSETAQDLQQKQAEALHKLAYAVSRVNNEIKELLQQKEGAYNYAKQSGDYGDFHAVIKELEKYMMDQIKNDSNFQDLYTQWDKAVIAVEEHRLSLVKDSDKTKLKRAYDYKQNQRRSSLSKSVSINI